MTNSLTPERLARLRELLGTAEPGRLLLTAPQLVVFDLPTCRALLDAADDLVRVREALQRGFDAFAAIARVRPLVMWESELLEHCRAALVGGKE